MQQKTIICHQLYTCNPGHEWSFDTSYFPKHRIFASADLGNDKLSTTVSTLSAWHTPQPEKKRWSECNGRHIAHTRRRSTLETCIQYKSTGEKKVERTGNVIAGSDWKCLSIYQLNFSNSFCFLSLKVKSRVNWLIDGARPLANIFGLPPPSGTHPQQLQFSGAGLDNSSWSAKTPNNLVWNFTDLAIRIFLRGPKCIYII